MANLFSQGGGKAPETGHEGGSSSEFQRLEEREEVATTFGPTRRSLYNLPYDLMQAKTQRPVPVQTTMNRKMDIDQANAILVGLFNHLGVRGHPDNLQYAIHRGILLSHAKNSASTLNPDRAEIRVEGGSPINFWRDVVVFLGADARRWFRAYAELEHEIIVEILNKHRQADMSVQQDYEDIMWVASDRGLDRYPDLCFDSSDAVPGLTRQQRTAIMQSKATIFANINNEADVARVTRGLGSPRGVFTTSTNVKGQQALPAGPDY